MLSIGGCEQLVSPVAELLKPKDQWIVNGWHPSGYIVTDWIGETSYREVYGQLGPEKYKVAVLEVTSGPDQSDTPAGSRKRDSSRPRNRLEYLCDGSLLIPSSIVPPRLKVRVDGLIHGTWYQAEVVGAHRPTTRPEMAGRSPPPWKRNPLHPNIIMLDVFPIISVSRIVELRPDGSERVLWKLK